MLRIFNAPNAIEPPANSNNIITEVLEYLVALDSSLELREWKNTNCETRRGFFFSTEIQGHVCLSNCIKSIIFSYLDQQWLKGKILKVFFTALKTVKIKIHFAYF